MYRLFLTTLLLISASALPAAGQTAAGETVIVDGTSNTLLVEKQLILQPRPEYQSIPADV